MKTKHHPSILKSAAGLLLALAITAPSALPVEAAVVDDTYSLSTAPQGALTTMVVQNSAAPKRAYLRFALQQTAPSAPSTPRAQDADGPLPYGLKSEEVSRAVLRMYARVIAVGPVTLRVRAVNESWSEATLKSTLLPSPSPTPVVDVVVQPTTATAVNEYVHFDITSLVKDWVKFNETSPAGGAGGRANFGLVIESMSGATATVTFDTKESTVYFYPSVIQILVEPATVPARGDVSMGIFTNP